jgi:hypothetical protein
MDFAESAAKYWVIFPAPLCWAHFAYQNKACEKTPSLNTPLEFLITEI